MEERAMELSIEQVLELRTPELMSISGVQGVGQALCEGAPCIRVYVLTDADGERLPNKLDGFAVSPVVTGPIRPG